MKFAVESVRGGCRLGRLSDFGSCSDKVLTTPMCLLYTRGGSAPYLTRDMLQRVPELPPVTHLSLPTIVDQHENLRDFKAGIKPFAAMQDTLVYCSLQDPATPVPSGYNDKTGSAVWSRGGKVKLDVDLFMRVQAAVRPDMYQALCDCDTDRNSGRKRLAKSVDRTLNFLTKCLERHKDTEELAGCGVFGSLVGGHSEEMRVTCAREVARLPVDGFCLVGFHHYGPETENLVFDDIRDLVDKTLAELPADKPRVMHQVWSPDNVLRAVRAGIDIFDSSYTYIVSERGGALVFDHSLSPACMDGEMGATNGPAADSTSTGTPGNGPVRPFEINLNDKRYREDFSPLVAGCTCYTCGHHTRSYVHHLLNTSELLAGVLLNIHNIHHYSSFFVAVREALTSDRFNDLEEKINQHLH